MLTLKNISFSIANKLIIGEASLQIFEGQKVGLVGRNGSGKSTLFKLVTGLYTPDSGKVEFARGKKIVSVSQSMPPVEMTPLEFVLQSDTVRTSLLVQLETCKDNCKIAAIYDQLIAMDAFGAESRAASILKGLNFSDQDQNKPLGSFSGGYRMRVALACALFSNPDLLLLDEPTNHLDLETTLWLESFLKKASCAMLIISHDRMFINQVCNGIVHLIGGKTTYYSGNFDNFIDQFNLNQANTANYNKKIEDKKAHMMKFVNRFGAGQKAAQAQSRLKAIAKLKEIPVVKDDPTITFKFPKVAPVAPPAISYKRANIGYGDKVVLKEISGSIDPEVRMALLGKNGNGKTTFAKFLSGELSPISGSINRDRHLRVGYYRQDQFEKLDVRKTALQMIQELLPSATELAIRTHLGHFGFSGDKVSQSIESLSGGEQARLIFCQITAQKPNLLILDEPTNHLDMEMRQSLVEAITEFGGAVILITHDQMLLEQVADELSVVVDGKVTPYEKTIAQYISDLR